MNLLDIVIQKIMPNAGVSFEAFILIVITIGGFVFYVKSPQIGLMMHTLMFGCAFMWFYVKDFNWVLPLISFFMCIVLLALSIWATSKVSQLGGFN